MPLINVIKRKHVFVPELWFAPMQTLP